MRHQMFYPYVTISRVMPCDVTIFTFFLLFQEESKNFGICEATKDRSGASSKDREKEEHVEEASDWDSQKDADPELRHSNRERGRGEPQASLLFRCETRSQRQVTVISFPEGV